MINSKEKWLQEYRLDKDKTWIIVYLSDGNTFYFKEYENWYDIKKHILEKKLKVSKVRLQYRSNIQEIDLSLYTGIYIIRSMFGTPSQTTQTLTIGQVKKDRVFKQVWISKGLILEESYWANKNTCYEEALLEWID